MKSVKRKRHSITTRKSKYKNKHKKKTIKLKRRKNIPHQNKNQCTRKHKKVKTKKQIGGDTPMTKIIKDINFFTENDKKDYSDIEEYLNPIYGVIMYESGYIENNYYLAKQRKEYEKRKEEARKKKEAQQVSSPEEEKKEGIEQTKKDDDNKLTPEMELIFNISTVVPPNVKPTKDIIQHMDTNTIGRFIAALYFYIQTTDKYMYDLLISRIKQDKNPNNIPGVSRAFAHFANFFQVNPKEEKKEEKKISKEMFHILLYCLWWTADNMNGISEYYKGLNTTFNQINSEIAERETREKRKSEYYKGLELNTTFNQIKKIKKKKKNFTILGINPEITKEEEKRQSLKTFALFPDKIKDTFEEKKEDDGSENESFESVVGIMCYKPIKVINYEDTKLVDEKTGTELLEYPDCVETTMRNFINFLLFKVDGDKFVISGDFKGINEKTIEYYTIFNSYDLQLSDSKKTIYGKQLNARDAWSYLIVNYANENISFKRKSETIAYEVLSGVMSVDGKKTNFIQLLQNLTSSVMFNSDNIEKELHRLTPLITEVYDENEAFKKGLGTVKLDYVINPILKYNIKFDLDIGHSYVTIEDGEKHQIKLAEHSKNKYIRYLSSSIEIIELDITDENYLWFKYTPESLVHLYEKLKGVYYILELLSSELVNKDTRRRVRINADELPKDFLKYNNSVDDFTYSSHDFTFVDKIPHLTSLNHVFKNKSITELPNLEPLINLTSIGNGFANYCGKLITIDLTQLINLTKIGDNFASWCGNLNTIKLNNLSKLTTIGNQFARSCSQLKIIGLTNLSELESIGNGFAYYCDRLETIDLSDLTNLKTIGDNFIQYCGMLKQINVENLGNLKKIGSGFALGSRELEFDISDLANLESIGDGFCYRSKTLQSINLTKLDNLKTIGMNFATDCDNLKTVALIGLSKLETIGDNFARDCDNLKTVALIGLSKLETIGDNFAFNCANLTTIKLDDLPKLQIIGDDFAVFCSNLKTNDLSNLPMLETIGNNFALVEKLDLSKFPNLKR